MSEILIRQSQIEGSMGGDISFRDIYLFDNTLHLDLLPEEAFFSTTLYKGLYIHNINKDNKTSLPEISGVIRDISVVSIGGIAPYDQNSLNENTYIIDDSLLQDLIEEAIYERVSIVDKSGGRIIREDDTEWDRSLVTFYDWLYDRYLKGVPPFLPTYNELSEIDAKYPGKEDGLYPERQDFENLKVWFSRNFLSSMSSRSSMFTQVKVDVYVPSTRVLDPIGYDTYELPFSRVSSEIPYLDSYKPGERGVGDYWGFYLRISVEFNPEWKINTDSTMLMVRWTDSEGEDHSKIIKILVNGNTMGIQDFNMLNVEKLYDKYPPFFRYYED